MYLTTKSGRKLKVTTYEEDAKIIAAAESDPDSRPWTEEELARVKQVQRGRPKSVAPKEHVTIRLDADILQTLRASEKDLWNGDKVRFHHLINNNKNDL